jgi:hypothetical protein
MSRKSNIRKPNRQKKREHHPRELAAPISPITGETQQALQTPTHSDLRRCSTASLIREIERLPESRGLIAAIAEAQAKGL